MSTTSSKISDFFMTEKKASRILDDISKLINSDRRDQARDKLRELPEKHYNVKSSAGYSFLHLAAILGMNDEIEYYLRLFPNNIDAADNYGNTALYEATCNRHTSTVELLINKGANINATNHKDITALHKAAYNGHTETMKTLIDNGANINATNNYGNTALHEAAVKGHTETIKTLIDNGADVNATNNNGQTALHEASKLGKTATTELLIDKGADVNATNNNGQTALHFAACNGRTKTIKTLIDNGANINATSRGGNTALHYAAYNGHTEAMKTLINNRADVNAANNYGNTALHEAADNGHTEAMKTLIDNGADITLKNRGNKTAADIAKHPHEMFSLALSLRNEELCKQFIDKEIVPDEDKLRKFLRSPENSNREHNAQFMKDLHMIISNKSNMDLVYLNKLNEAIDVYGEFHVHTLESISARVVQNILDHSKERGVAAILERNKVKTPPEHKNESHHRRG
ncbi:ankyrin repeat domain-containing protein [Rickettsiales bacterium]|nr:ankyrin repeat domain-containing protein [Rickettsiales bacterium]